MSARFLLPVPVVCSFLLPFIFCPPQFTPPVASPPLSIESLGPPRYDDYALRQVDAPSYGQPTYDVDHYDITPRNAPPDYDDDRSYFDPMAPQMSYRYRCCSSCTPGDIECFMTCQRSCLPQRGCEKAGQNVYAITCQRICGMTLRGSSFVPLAACRGICAAQAQIMCQRYACREYGCTPFMAGPRCLREAPRLCG
eukprot:GHVS01096851.1.p1 GENE.GHVS01096851.1~~GHVS01096851.1.p1  ORF type:complete len:196 (+),score=10.55 GHVS01096851.1:252-839(+)